MSNNATSQGPLERPARPECFEFAMDFLGDPENEIVRAYVDALESWADAAVAAERERCAKLCEEMEGAPGGHFATRIRSA